MFFFLFSNVDLLGWSNCWRHFGWSYLPCVVPSSKRWRRRIVLRFLSAHKKTHTKHLLLFHFWITQICSLLIIESTVNKLLLDDLFISFSIELVSIFLLFLFSSGFCLDLLVIRAHTNEFKKASIHLSAPTKISVWCMIWLKLNFKAVYFFLFLFGSFVWTNCMRVEFDLVVFALESLKFEFQLTPIQFFLRLFHSLFFK